MYRTKIFWAANVEDVTNLQLATSSSTSVSVSITYASSATMKNGIPVLVDPATRTFTQGSLGTLKGYYIELDDEVYLFPSSMTVSRTLSSGTYTWKASSAQRIINTGLTLYSGVSEPNAIRSCKITYESNDGDDLVLGSVCTACLEAKIVAPGGELSITTGAELIVYKVAPDGTETQIGVFTCEKPTRLTAHTYKITAYDNVRKLDVDMTEWLKGLTGWPYAVTDFYGMICEECGLEYHWSTWSGASDVLVYQFDVENSVTARQLVSWCAEVMGDYCIANPDGSLQCHWYKTSYIKLYKTNPPGDDPEIEQTYYQESLSYEDFEVEDADEVLVRADDSEDSPLWPVVDAVNPYIITGNPIILNHPDYISGTNSFVWDVLDKIRDRYNFLVYRPFKVTIPELLEARVGRYAMIETDRGTILAPITSLVWTGQKMKLECTAKWTRDNADSPEYKTNKQLMEYSDQVAKKETAKVTDHLAINKQCSDCNEALTPGFYYLSGASCLNYPSKIPSGNYGVLLVERRYGEVYQTVRYGNYIAFRHSNRDEDNVDTVVSWEDWIVINLAALTNV